MAPFTRVLAENQSSGERTFFDTQPENGKFRFVVSKFRKVAASYSVSSNCLSVVTGIWNIRD